MKKQHRASLWRETKSYKKCATIYNVLFNIQACLYGTFFNRLNKNSCSASDFETIMGSMKGISCFLPNPERDLVVLRCRANRQYTKGVIIVIKDSKLASHYCSAVSGGLLKQTNGNLAATTKYAKHTRALPIFSACGE